MTDVEQVRVPDIGDFEEVEVIEVLVKAGDRVRAEDSLITLESEKATMEVPVPRAGTVQEVTVAVGDSVSEGSPILTLRPEAAPEPERPAAEGVNAPTAAQPEKAPPQAPRTAPPTEPRSGARPAPVPPVDRDTQVRAHASPAVRRLARELGADLGAVHGSGPKGRIRKEDVQAHVRAAMQRRGGSVAGPAGLPPWPEVDFDRFGAVEERPLTRVQQVAGANLHRNWVTIPHVTQFGEADVTELEAFRRSEGERLQADGVRLSPLAFFVKASVAALRRFPDFNSSLAADGSHLIRKRYFHIGVAVDTPHGLMVPVLRDADRKGVLELARELAELARQARARKLGPEAMQGGCFTVSSLGGIGGSHFTPIINAPEVAILGVSRLQPRLVLCDGQPQERLFLPLSLSYDHRVIDGAAGARFMVYLGELLGDVRRLLL